MSKKLMVSLARKLSMSPLPPSIRLMGKVLDLNSLQPRPVEIWEVITLIIAIQARLEAHLDINNMWSQDGHSLRVVVTLAESLLTLSLEEGQECSSTNSNDYHNHRNNINRRNSLKNKPKTP